MFQPSKVVQDFFHPQYVQYPEGNIQVNVVSRGRDALNLGSFLFSQSSFLRPGLGLDGYGPTSKI